MPPDLWCRQYCYLYMYGHGGKTCIKELKKKAQFYLSFSLSGSRCSGGKVIFANGYNLHGGFGQTNPYNRSLLDVLILASKKLVYGFVHPNLTQWMSYLVCGPF